MFKTSSLFISSFRRIRPGIALISLSFFWLVRCGTQDVDDRKDEYAQEIPGHFPSPSNPDDNELTPERVRLGRMLFYDPILSRDTSVSCGSCHFQERAFTTPDPRAIGIDGKIGMRNAMSLANIAYSHSFFRDGGVPTLEMQVLAPVEDSMEMDLPFTTAAERLKDIPGYVELSRKAYNREPDPFVITRAIAAFERTLISSNSPYDRYLEGETSAMTSDQIAGMDLFFGDRMNCASCHSGFNFTDNSFRNIGQYEQYEDSGRARVTTLHEHVGMFKVPSLRNVAVTGPYMHDGSMASLSEVIDLYSDGGKGHWNQDSLIQPFGLTLEEKDQLISFLRALTDSSFLNDPRFSEPEEFYR